MSEASKIPFEVISSPDAPKAIGPYSQAVAANGFLFCSGQIPLNPTTGEMVTGDITACTEQVLSNIRGVLAAAGVGFEAIVKTTIYLIDMADFPAVNAVYGKAFNGTPPARSTVAVASLPRGATVEIEVLALMP